MAAATAAAAANGEGHADADAEQSDAVRRVPDVHGCLGLGCWCTARSLSIHSTVIRPLPDPPATDKRQRSSHETMRRLGRVDPFW